MQPAGEQIPVSVNRVVMPCNLQAAREVCLSVKEILSNHGLSEIELRNWELILAESINNAVDHVEKRDCDTPLEVEVKLTANDVTVEVHDHTRGFDWPTEVRLPDVDSEGGRGIFLIQNLTDSVDYRKGRHGNTLVMRRASRNIVFPAAAGGAQAGKTELNGEALRSLTEGLEGTLDAMTEELSSCYESLSAIFRFSAELGQSQKTEDFAKRLLNHVLEIAEADWFVFRQYFRDRRRLVLLSASDASLRLPDLDVGDQGEGDGIELRSVNSRQDEWISPGEEGSDNEPLHAVVQDAFVIVHPIFLNEELLGVLTVGRGRSAGPLKAAQISFINTFAQFLAIQIANASYQQERISKEILTRELEIAINIQRSLLPTELPGLGGFQLAASCDSAGEVGGDFYDVISLEDGCLALVIADVMGKGIPAALFAAKLRSLFRAMPERAQRPGQLMTSVNQILYEELSSVDMFITSQLVYIDPSERVLKVASAGHCPALIASADWAKVCSVCPEGMPLGVLHEADYEEAEVGLGNSPIILIYTDGITEAVNPRNEQFGNEALVEWLLSKGAERWGAAALKTDLLATVSAFQGEADPRDDMAFIVVAERG